MKPVSEIIRKKRQGLSLDADELSYLVEGFSKGTIPDYQISAWLMASFLCGLDHNETFLLTQLMRNSGETLDWRSYSDNFKNARFADKHSTGGVGDKVSLILAPLAACLGLKVPMMSGRGLGHTGGTVDKLQSINGFNMYPSKEQMIRSLDEVGICMMAQSENLCPADRKLYSLRDVTATVESIPLITASIVSKKWAEGIDAIVYDVKCGKAAFMSNIEDARNLAESLVKTSRIAELDAVACISRMEEPLGSMIGNSLEVIESLWILENNYPSKEHQRIIAPLKNLCVDLAAEMAVLAGTRDKFPEARNEALNALQSGLACSVFEKMLTAQGASEDWRRALPKAKHIKTLQSEQSGHLIEVLSRTLGVLGLKIGIGREKAEDSITPSVGFEILVAPGDDVQKGQDLLKLHCNNEDDLEKLKPALLDAFVFEESSDKLRILSKALEQNSLVMERILA